MAIVIPLTTIVTVILWSYALFLYYLAYVTVIRAKDEGRLKEANLFFKAGAYLTVWTGGVIDILFNIFLGSLLFWELPEFRNFTFTHRCAKWMSSNGWRGRLARGICVNLGVFDPRHCKPRS